MNGTRRRLALAIALLLGAAGTAHAGDKAPATPSRKAIALGDGVTLEPVIDARLRWEDVDQPPRTGVAITLRVRAGAELRHAPSHLALLAEVTSTTPLLDDYNALPYIPVEARPQFATIADAETLDLNRLQLRYADRRSTITVGRQRITLDDQRWVGNAGWRQNEQRFDAARIETRLGPIAFDVTRAINQVTTQGNRAGPRRAYGGRFWFLGAGAKVGPVAIKGFAYLLDYNAEERGGALAALLANTQTYGVRANTRLGSDKTWRLDLAGSYARQASWVHNPAHYAVDYWSGDATLVHRGWTGLAGIEHLGSDGQGHAVQTPTASLHKWQGWADVLTTTPGDGVRDIWLGGSKAIRPLHNLTATAIWHDFRSTAHDRHYATEWDASLAMRLGKVSLLATYADFRARDPAFASTRKVWLEADYLF